MPKRKEPESSSPAMNMEHRGAMPARLPPREAILALEAPNISDIRSLRGRAGSRSGRGRSGGNTISGSGGRSGSDNMPGRGGRGGESISRRGGKSERCRGRGRRQPDQETAYHPNRRLPTKQQRKILLREKARENIGTDLATISMRRESSYTSRNVEVVLTPTNNIAEQALSLSNPMAMIHQREADVNENSANAPALEFGASTQADPSMEPQRQQEADKAKLSLKSLEPID